MKKIYYILLAVLFTPSMIFAQPANDDCSTAAEIEIDGPAITADNTDADITGDIASCFLNQTAGDVWYTFTITEATTLNISTTAGTTDDTQLTLFSIEDCGGDNEAYTEIACNDDVDLFADNYLSSITVVELGAGTYFIKAGTYNAATSGSFDISIVTTTPAENDACEDATVLEVNGPSAIADNTASGIDGPEGSCYGTEQVYGDTWFTFTTTEVMDIEILSEKLEEDEGSMDSQVAVFTIEGCGTEEEEYTEIACNDDLSDNNTMSQIFLPELAPGTYYIKAGTYSDFIVGPYTISVYTSSANGISEMDNASFSVFPNPAIDQFSIRTNDLSGKYTIELIDLSGRIIHQQLSQLNYNSTTIVNTEKAKPGVYIIRMTNNEENSFLTQRIVIQ